MEVVVVKFVYYFHANELHHSAWKVKVWKEAFLSSNSPAFFIKLTSDFADSRVY